MIEKTIASKKCFIYPSENASKCLIQPVDERDLELLDKEVEEIKSLTDKPFVFVAFSIEDWNKELSPWEAPAVFGKEYEETPFPPKRGFSCDCPDKMDLCSFSESDLVCGSGSRHDLVVSLFEGKYLTCRFIELIGC